MRVNVIMLGSPNNLKKSLELATMLESSTFKPAREDYIKFKEQVYQVRTITVDLDSMEIKYEINRV